MKADTNDITGNFVLKCERKWQYNPIANEGTPYNLNQTLMETIHYYLSLHLIIVSLFMGPLV